MFGSHRLPATWFIINLAGIAIFLVAASSSWIEPELATVPGASAGDAFVWFVTAVPVLSLFLIANLAWLAASLKSGISSAVVTFGYGAAILACWICAYSFDNAHHGI